MSVGSTTSEESTDNFSRISRLNMGIMNHSINVILLLRGNCNQLFWVGDFLLLSFFSNIIESGFWVKSRLPEGSTSDTCRFRLYVCKGGVV